MFWKWKTTHFVSGKNGQPAKQNNMFMRSDIQTNSARPIDMNTNTRTHAAHIRRCTFVNAYTGCSAKSHRVKGQLQ